MTLMIVIFLAQVEGVSDVVIDVAQYGLIPSAALAAYRLSARSHSEATNLAKATAQSFRTQLQEEREHYESMLESKDQRIRELETMLLARNTPIAGLWPQPKDDSES